MVRSLSMTIVYLANTRQRNEFNQSHKPRTIKVTLSMLRLDNLKLGFLRISFRYKIPSGGGTAKHAMNS